MDQSSAIALSICMPVYNCAEFVEEALDAILRQGSEAVEIVVYDGGSTDSTQDVVLRIAARSPQVRYHRAGARGGIDADLAGCVSLARGRYCWLFSGDDVTRPGALVQALAVIEGGHDVYLCEHTLCDRAMRKVADYPVMRPNVCCEAELSDAGERLLWFGRAVNTEGFFSFMSGIIVRRDTWLAGRLIDEFDGSCWAHVARLFELSRRGLRACYVAQVWLDKRGENDSFCTHGIVRRYALAIDGFANIAEHFFGAQSKEAFHIRRTLRHEFDLGMLLNAKLLTAENPRVESRELLDRLVGRAYCDPDLRSLLVRLAYRWAPAWLLRVSRWERRLRRRLRQSG